MSFKLTIPKSLSTCKVRDYKLGVLKVIVAIAFIFFVHGNIYSQQTTSGIPFSVTHDLPLIENYNVMPVFQQAKTLKSDKVSSRLKRLKFAHTFDLSLNPDNSGEWLTLNNGDRVWRIGLASKNAYSLNLIFGVYHLEPDAKLYIYSPDQEHMLGAFTSSNNNSAEVLAIEPLPGDSLIVEINVPASVEDYGKIEITRLGHDYMDILGTSLKSAPIPIVSGACNVDINCDEGLQWQREKYAVCKLIINAEDICTGALINNTSYNTQPYVLTAHHCIDASFKANNTVFIFNFEKWKCSGEGGPKPLSMSGSDLIATTPNLDFSLVKLYGLPPFSVRPYYAGWDMTGAQPKNTVTIHHPNGDVKKITVDDNPPVTATFEEDYNPNTHWLINRWEKGTTEVGSSGAPLFNQDHQIVGNLTGGDATCANPTEDYFAKFSDSWSDYNDWRYQLRHWLDPSNSDSAKIGGLDLYAAQKASCDTFTNISKGETIRLYDTNLSWGSYSGHNSQLITQFAEKINIGGGLKIPGFYLHVAKAYNSSSVSFITIKLWKGGDVPGDEISTRSVFLKDLSPNRVNYLEFDSTLYVSGPVYLGYSVNYTAKPDTFSLYQAQNRGETGTSGMFVFKENKWLNISEVTPSIYSSLALGIVSCDLLSSRPIKELHTYKLNVYPNPVTSGTLIAEIPQEKNLVVSVFDLSGREIRADKRVSENQLTINTSGLRAGMYILKILVPGKGLYNARFLVVK